MNRIVAGIVALVACRMPGAQAIPITIINDTAQTAYFQFGGQGVAQGTVQLKPSDPVMPLSPSMKFGIDPDSKLTGINLTYVDAGKMLFSLDRPLSGQAPGFSPQFQPNSGPDALIRHDKVELTVHGDSFDSANLSSTDFFGLRLNVETLKNGSPVSTLTWRADTASVFQALAATTLNNSPNAVLTGAAGLPVQGLGNVLRIIAPSTADPHAYPTTMQSYLNYVAANNIATHVVGKFFGNPGRGLPPTTYDFTAVLLPNGDMQMIGTLASGPGQHTIIVPAVDSLNRTLAQQLYLLNPKFTVDGKPEDNSFNDAFVAAVRDYLAGYSFGLVGSTAIDPRHNVPFMNEPTDVWYDPNNHLTVNDVFSHAAPQPGFFNAYTEQVALVSDSYGFPFTDVLGKPLASLDPGRVDQLVVTIMPDTGNVDPVALLSTFQVEDFLVPEPSGMALLLPALGLLGPLTRLRNREAGRSG